MTPNEKRLDRLASVVQPQTDNMKLLLANQNTILESMDKKYTVVMEELKSMLTILRENAS